MSYLSHQVKASDELLAIIRQKAIALLAGLPRTGKTRAAIRVAEKSKAGRILVVTKKAAIDGWHSELEAVNALKIYTVTNYEQVAKLEEQFDFVIVDESHNIGRPGKPTQRLQALKQVAYGLPVLLLTGTPAAETHLAYYYQFSLSKWSPFAAFRNFYEFFNHWGMPHQIKVNGHLRETYKRARPELLPFLSPYIVKISQDDAGIKYQAQDRVHTVILQPETKALIEKIKKDKVAHIGGQLRGFETDIAERVAVHQLEYGAVLLDDEIVDNGNTEVVDFLLKEFGDYEDIGFMCHFRSTRFVLEKFFKKAKIFSSNAHAEGVNLSHLAHFVIVNSDYSGARFVQRRERITNINRTTEAVVHHIVTDGGISKSVYQTLRQKKDFTLKLYRDERIRRSKENYQTS